MRIYPAVHYTMGGLWVDYHLMSNLPGLFVLGEANFSDHGANRLGASALMQGLADGYFVISYTLGQLPGAAARHRAGAGRRPGLRRGRSRRVDDQVKRILVDRGHAVGRPLPPRARQDHVGLLRHGPQQDRPREGRLRDPGAARPVLEGRPGPRRRPDEPEPRARRARGRLHRVRRADVPRRPAPRGVVRRPLPRGAARPRTARPCATTSTSPTWRPGSGRPGRHARRSTRSRSTFEYGNPTQRSYK